MSMRKTVMATHHCLWLVEPVFYLAQRLSFGTSPTFGGAITVAEASSKRQNIGCLKTTSSAMFGSSFASTEFVKRARLTTPSTTRI